MRVPGKISDERGAHDEDIVEAATAWFVRMRSDLVTDTDRHNFQAWLARDPAHPEAYAQAKALWDEFGEMPDPRADFDVHDFKHGMAMDHELRSRPWQRQAARRYGSLAACIAFAAVVSLWSIGGYDGLRADYITGVGEIRTVTLPDGSVADLNTDTAIAINFSEGHRQIELYRGEAFFMVAKDAKRPFDVVTSKGVSRAVGTAFDVLDMGKSVTVTVQEGVVRVSRSPIVMNDAEGIVLQAGETARYGKTGNIKVDREDTETATAWRQGRLVFVNRRLRDVVTELDRYRPGIITLIGSDLANEKFTGVFSLTDTDRALDAIEGSLPVDVTRITPYVTLLRARD